MNEFLFESVFADQWCYNDEDLERVRRNLGDAANPRILAPSDIDWLLRARDKTLFEEGFYTMNPALQGLELTPESLVVVDVPELCGRSLADVGAHVVAMADASHLLPGIETLERVFRHPAAFPWLRDTTTSYYYFGSLLRSQDSWRVLSSYWNLASLNSKALDEPWSSADRVLFWSR